MYRFRLDDNLLFEFQGQGWMSHATPVEFYGFRSAVERAALLGGPLTRFRERAKSPPFDKLRAGFLAKNARNGAPDSFTLPGVSG